MIYNKFIKNFHQPFFVLQIVCFRDEFNESEENQNTKRKTELDVNLIHSYIASEAVWPVNRPPRIEEMSPSELDTYLSKFMLAVRKKNGEEYEPTTLFEVLCLQSNVM